MSSFSTLDLLDRERLNRRFMTLVRKNDEVHQRGQQGLKLVKLLLAQPRIEHGFDSADNPGSRQARVRASCREELLSLGIEALCEVIHKFDTTPNCGRTSGP